MSYCFVLAGEIIELGSAAEPQPFKTLIPILDRESRKLSETIQSPTTSEGRGSLLYHVYRIGIYPTEQLLKKPGILISPRGLGGFGIKTGFEVIGKHYQYFIKNEDPWS